MKPSCMLHNSKNRPKKKGGGGIRILNITVKSKTRKGLKALNIYISEPVTQNGSNGVIMDNTQVTKH